jgi:hypothetical protein
MGNNRWAISMWEVKILYNIYLMVLFSLRFTDINKMIIKSAVSPPQTKEIFYNKKDKVTN